MTTSIAKSLTLKWMAFSILLATIPLAIVGFSINQIYQEDLKRCIIEIEKGKAQMVVERTEAFFEKALSNLLLLSREENFGKGGLSNTKGHFENVLYNNDYLVELTLLDKKGQETFKISKYRGFDPSDLKNRSKSKMFEVASKGQTYYGEFHLTTDVVPTMVIAVPIEGHRGGPFAVLSAKIHLRYLWDLLPHTQIGKEGSTYVVNKEGDLIAHPDTRRVLLGLNVKDRPMVKQVVDGKEGYLEFEHPQEGRNLVVYKPIRRLGWGVIVQVPVEEAYKPLRQIANTALKWILIALTIAIIFSLFLTKKLTLPIKRLSKEMGEVAKGNLNTYIQPTSKDEIGLLTESFNHMIQDLKQSHEALKKAEQKYRGIFENAVEGIFQISREGRFLSVNPALASMHGYESPEELMDTITDVPEQLFVNPKDGSEISSLLKKKNVIHNFETQAYRKDGNVIWISLDMRGIYDSGGRLIYHEGIVQDITERKRAEEELQKAYRKISTLYSIGQAASRSLRLENVLSTALGATLKALNVEAGGVFLLEPDGETMTLHIHQGHSDEFVKNVGRIKLGEGISGLSATEKKPVVLDVPDYPTERLAPFIVQEGIKTLASTPLLSGGELVGAMNLATRRPHAFPPDELELIESIGIHLAGIVQNARLYEEIQEELAERKRAEEEKRALEEQLRQSQKLEAVGKLAGGIAHDFNNLLTVITGYSDSILNQLQPHDLMRGEALEIKRAGERAASLTRQLLAFSRKQMLKPKILDLNDLITNMDKMLRRLIGEDIYLTTNLAKGLGKVKADPGQIEQVIMNVIVNARDAMPSGGKLTIETANVELDEYYAQARMGVTPGHYSMISITDTGIGMSREVREQIFEPFFTTKEAGQGTGLGLSTAYGIVKQSGGNIWVYSEPGKGTTFKIYLPRIEEGVELVQPGVIITTKPAEGSETILLVEDEEILRRFAHLLLQKNGYRLLEASNGEEALRIVQEQRDNPIHLLVTDVVMPGMSGRELADSLESLRPEMKVLYMSGYTEDAVVHHGVMEERMNFIQKPFTREELARKVREVLDEQAVGSDLNT